MLAVDDLKQAVIDGQVAAAERIVRQAVQEGADPLRLYRGALIPAMEEVGRRMQSGEYFLPEVLIAAKAMKGASAVLKPIMVQQPAGDRAGKVVIGTVEGDMHDIGKNLVLTMLEGGGFEVIDLGVDSSAEKIARAVQEEKPEVLALSALLTTTMLKMKGVIKALEDGGLRSSVKVIVGGAPVTQAFCDEIKADGFSADAAGAVVIAKKLVGASA